MQGIRSVRFEQVDEFARHPGREQRPQFPLRLFMYLGHFVQSRSQTRLVMGNLELHHFAACELALADHFQ